MTEANAVAVRSEMPRGIEGVNRDDLIIPSAVLMQGLSKWCAEFGKRPGEIVNSLSHATLTSTEFVPIITTKYWDLLRNEGGKMVFAERVTDENDTRLQGRKLFPDKVTGEPADATCVRLLIALFEGKALAVRFSKKSYQGAKQLISLAQNNGGDFWAHKYKLVPKTETNRKGTFFVLTVEYVGQSNEQERAAAEMFYISFGHKAKEMMEEKEAKPEGEEVPF